MTLKIVQFGLCYSPNLGDGIIADCLAYGLEQAGPPGTKVHHVDLSARQGRGDVTFRNRRLLLKVLDTLPQPLRHALARWKLNALIDSVLPSWHTAAQADLAVIGGGQIFSDASLNFPIKIARAARVLAETGPPVAVHAVGVSRNWTKAGRALFAEILTTDLRRVGVRDADSQADWVAQMPGGPLPQWTPDPGLLAADCYGPPDAGTGGVGLCVTDFGLLRHHADSGVAGARSGPVAFYVGVAQALVARGQTVTLFCNGASEDRALLARVAKALDNTSVRDKLAAPPVPGTPAELARQIAGFDAVIAHRLHACIVAYSYARPVVGLGWDRKLESFFALIEAADSLSTDPNLTAEGVADMTVEALARGVPKQRHQRILADTHDSLRRLLKCIEPNRSDRS